MQETTRVLDCDAAEGGEWVFAGGLTPIPAARAVGSSDPVAMVTDGPYIETKEHRSFWVVDVLDADAARYRRSMPTSGSMPRRPDVEELTLVGGMEKRRLVIVDYDPSWPEIYREHARRIKHALGATAQVIEHIGSTSVPDLAAKPIIDILVIVEDITAEEDYLEPLLAANYLLRVREPGHRMVRTPARDVHVHLLQVGAP